MAYNQQMADRIREALMDLPIVEEKKMFQGVCFMVNDKLCVCVRNNDILCRIGEQQAELELEKGNCNQMLSGDRVMKGYVYVEDFNLQTNKDLKYWINLCLEFNPLAEASKKKKPKK
ncbi:TfoX N-terminal domain-containing protein [Mucilaginibacter gossypiicola]|uniref:TfoX N-terminal domain-containing protein n=1 Tax=Mucilaginibacter gossypiicola TaxID=551995 RepID=A0A1H8K9H2_9SPHI|nr:TfoX/Sxy family protein [Mucilaginibacter gossypiicola]SEN89351.1 TfoX N-terminal domain-containing protein [Mucilaginibacter gossypiicola]